MRRERWLAILIALIWFGSRAYVISHDWSGESVSSWEDRFLNEDAFIWGKQHPECRDRFGFWPDGTRMDDSELDSISHVIRSMHPPSIEPSEKLYREKIARNEWAADIRAKIASCEEAQWMPIAKASAIRKLRIQLVTSSLIPPVIVLLVFYGSMWIWKRFGATNWSRMPTNLRRGVLRLYLAVAIPWILWFAYRISDDAAQSSRRRYLEGDILALLTMPLGVVVLFMIGGWIVDGFRRPSPGNAKSVNSESPQGTKTNQPSPPDGFTKDADAIFRKLDSILQSEKAQIDLLPEPYRSKVLSGVACDEIAGASGEFGRDIRNPIPVNGPLGELIYLSNLRVANSQQPIMFHRLGSVGAIDVFETVSFDGKMWDFLFVDLYHPRKSGRSPVGYQIADGRQRERLLLGTNEFVAQFPKELPTAISIACERLIGLRLRPPEVRVAIERTKFARPADHQATYRSLIASLSPKISSGSPIDFIEVGKLLGKMLLNPDDCWADVCKLREYKVPDAVATCEMAFARAAVIKDAVKRLENDNVNKKMNYGIDKFVEEAFEKERVTEELLAHYQSESFTDIARRVVRFYEENVFPLTHLADQFAARLSVPGIPSIEIAPLFEEVAAEAERLVRFSQSAQRVREMGDPTQRVREFLDHLSRNG
jgi:hypothetical protein